jgi:hypothetical protein
VLTMKLFLKIWITLVVRRDWSDDSRRNYSLKRRYFSRVACLAEWKYLIFRITQLFHSFPQPQWTKLVKLSCK